MNLPEMVGKLVLAVLLGGLVGIERERRDRPAGLRTHIVVCVGSTLITLVSIVMAGDRGEPTRIAAQIVSGIGFLGAGTIFRAGNAVRGLTTAAGLWAVAGIGMGVAAGRELLILAAVTAAMIFGVNNWVRVVEDRIVRTHQQVVLNTARSSGVLTDVLRELDERGIFVDSVQWLADSAEGSAATLRLRLRLPRTWAAEDTNSLTAWITHRDGVTEILWE